MKQLLLLSVCARPSVPPGAHSPRPRWQGGGPQELRSWASLSGRGSSGPRTSCRQEPARLPALQRRRAGWPGSRVPGGSGAGEARGPGRRGAELSRAEQRRPPPPGRAQPSQEPRARAQRRASAAPEGRARVRVHPPAADTALPAPYRHLLRGAAGSRRCGRGSARTPAKQPPACPRGLRALPGTLAKHSHAPVPGTWDGPKWRGHTARVGRRPKRLKGAGLQGGES